MFVTLGTECAPYKSPDVFTVNGSPSIVIGSAAVEASVNILEYSPSNFK